MIWKIANNAIEMIESLLQMTLNDFARLPPERRQKLLDTIRDAIMNSVRDFLDESLAESYSNLICDGRR